MTDEPTRMPIGEAIEAGIWALENAALPGDYVDAALAAFDGWGEAIDEEWLDQRFAREGAEPSEPMTPIWAVGMHYRGVLRLHRTPTGYHLWYKNSGHLVHGRMKTRGELMGLLHFLSVTP